VAACALPPSLLWLLPPLLPRAPPPLLLPWYALGSSSIAAAASRSAGLMLRALLVPVWVGGTGSALDSVCDILRAVGTDALLLLGVCASAVCWRRKNLSGALRSEQPLMGGEGLPGLASWVPSGRPGSGLLTALVRIRLRGFTMASSRVSACWAGSAVIITAVSCDATLQTQVCCCKTLLGRALLLHWGRCSCLVVV
jgi:hypothetical protein